MEFVAAGILIQDTDSLGRMFDHAVKFQSPKMVFMQLLRRQTVFTFVKSASLKNKPFAEVQTHDPNGTHPFD